MHKRHGFGVKTGFAGTGGGDSDFVFAFGVERAVVLAEASAPFDVALPVLAFSR